MDQIDNNNHSETLALHCGDGNVFHVPKKCACISRMIRNASENNEHEVPIPSSVDYATLERIIRFMNYHQGVVCRDEKDRNPSIPLTSNVMKDVCKDEWDANYIDCIGNNIHDLVNLLNAALCIDIPSLIWLGQAKFASLIKGQEVSDLPLILSGKMIPKNVPNKGNFFDEKGNVAPNVTGYLKLDNVM